MNIQISKFKFEKSLKNILFLTSQRSLLIAF